MEKFIAELIEPLLVESTIKNESLKLKKLLSKLRIPKSYIDNQQKLIIYLQNNPAILTQFLKLVGESALVGSGGIISGAPDPKKVKRVRKQIDKEREKVDEAKVIKKVIGIYAGRFQPFGPHHKKVYEWIKKQFDDAYITTSDKKGLPRHPMNFKEKKRHIVKMGIPSNKVQMERIPYVASGVLKKFEKDTTAVVYIFGAKDADRLKGGTKKGGGKTYYQDYKKNKNNLEPAWKHGYILTAPHVSIKAGGMEVSGTAMRQLLGSPKYADDRERRFKKFFGYFDKGVFSMMVNKFKKLFEDKNILNRIDISKELNLIIEGGAYGHMSHPFDDKNLTFKDLKNIIEMGLGGQLSREDNVSEKLDGQNLMISWRDGNLIAARSKSQLKNAGKTALNTNGIISKFSGRGDIADAFGFAMTDLEKAIGKLSDKQRDKIFMQGKAFMNLEVMWPKSANVINYDKAEIVFHGALEYDDSGTVVGEVKGSGRILQGMIQQVNQHIQKHYKIGKPVFLEVPKNQDFGTKKKGFIGRLTKLQKHFALKDTDTLSMYHQSFWEEFIFNAAKQIGYKIPIKVLKGLVKRWAFFDKKYGVRNMKKDIKNEDFLDWALSTDKKDHSKMVKENIKPFEILFFEVGAEILKNITGYMAANPDEAIQKVRKSVKKAISDVRRGGDVKKLGTLKAQLDKLNAIGGLDAVVPSEGIVFKYKGNTYKFTGAFAPINQITGLIDF